MQEEIWKDIPGFEGRYQVSSFGRIKSLPRKVKSGRTYRYVKEHILSCRYDCRGYARVCIRIHPKKYWFSVHRLVAEIFIPNPNNYPVVNHIDNNPRNNCANNLEWCTQSYNVKHAYNCGRAKPNIIRNRNGKKIAEKIPVCQYTMLGDFIEKFDSIKEASLKTNTSAKGISLCCKNTQKISNNYIWRYAN